MLHFAYSRLLPCRSDDPDHHFGDNQREQPSRASRMDHHRCLGGRRFAPRDAAGSVCKTARERGGTRMTEVRLFDAPTVALLTPYQKLIPLMAKTMAEVSVGAADLPLRSIMRLPNGHLFGVMPGFLEP